MGTNPMKADTRNQGLIGMADGIPMFRDMHSRGVIPIMFRSANMADSLSMKFRYTHLSALVPCHFWIIGDISKQFERVERKPGHLCAVMHAIVDDMLFWEDGQVVEDTSKLQGDPERWFRLRVMLLYWCGDYPGQGEASGFSHAASGSKACHWCEVRADKSMSIDRMKYEGYFRCAKILRFVLHFVLFANILGILYNLSNLGRILYFFVIFSGIC